MLSIEFYKILRHKLKGTNMGKKEDMKVSKQCQNSKPWHFWTDYKCQKVKFSQKKKSHSYSNSKLEDLWKIAHKLCTTGKWTYQEKWKMPWEQTFPYTPAPSHPLTCMLSCELNVEHRLQNSVESSTNWSTYTRTIQASTKRWWLHRSPHLKKEQDLLGQVSKTVEQDCHLIKVKI